MIYILRKSLNMPKKAYKRKAS